MRGTQLPPGAKPRQLWRLLLSYILVIHPFTLNCSGLFNVMGMGQKHLAAVSNHKLVKINSIPAKNQDIGHLLFSDLPATLHDQPQF